MLETLEALGFYASIVSEQKNRIVVRVWTTKGWAYERFDRDATAETVTAWAKDKEPGT